MKTPVTFFALVLAVAFFASAYSTSTIQHIDQDVQDTVYIGLVNKFKLNVDSSGIIRAESAQARVQVIGDTLMVMPTAPGYVEVTVHFKTSVETRKFISAYYPAPRLTQTGITRKGRFESR